MLLYITVINVLVNYVMCTEENKIKPYVFPIPLELPNRNDRSDQCWLRIEDVELTETLTIYCYIARDFLDIFIGDYNSRKMTQDGIEVTPWTEQPQDRDEIDKPINSDSIKDWKVNTVMDPTTHLRLYVTKNADCRLIMYSREGMTNYQVNCESILQFINDRISDKSAVNVPQNIIINLCLCIVYFLSKR